MRSTAAALASLALTSILARAATARADTILKRAGDHEHYRVELEPHLDVGFLHYEGIGITGKDAQLGSTDFGGGFRVTVIIVDPGFIPRLNNTVGITFG